MAECERSGCSTTASLQTTAPRLRRIPSAFAGSTRCRTGASSKGAIIASAFLASRSRNHRLDRTVRRSRQRQRPITQCDQRQRPDRLWMPSRRRAKPTCFAAFAFRTISRNARRIGADMVSKRSENLGIAAVDRETGTETGRWNPTENENRPSSGARRADRAAPALRSWCRRRCVPAAHDRAGADRVSFAFDDRLGGIEFGDLGNHREHDAQRAAAAGAQQSADLAAQQPGPVEAEPDRAPAERGIFPRPTVSI